jgi:hypothetical protein
VYQALCVPLPLSFPGSNVFCAVCEGAGLWGHLHCLRLHHRQVAMSPAALSHMTYSDTVKCSTMWPHGLWLPHLHLPCSRVLGVIFRASTCPLHSHADIHFRTRASSLLPVWPSLEALMSCWISGLPTPALEQVSLCVFPPCLPAQPSKSQSDLAGHQPLFCCQEGPHPLPSHSLLSRCHGHDWDPRSVCCMASACGPVCWMEQVLLATAQRCSSFLTPLCLCSLGLQWPSLCPACFFFFELMSPRINSQV